MQAPTHHVVPLHLQPVLLEVQRQEMTNTEDVTFVKVIKCAMRAVEVFASRMREGDEPVRKRDLCHYAISAVIFSCMTQGLVTASEAMALQNRVDSARDLVDDVIEGLIAVSKNPQFIQIAREAEKAVAACSPKCRKRARAKASAADQKAVAASR